MDLQRYSLAELFGMYFNLEFFDVLVGQEIDEADNATLLDFMETADAEIWRRIRTTASLLELFEMARGLAHEVFRRYFLEYIFLWRIFPLWNEGLETRNLEELDFVESETRLFAGYVPAADDDLIHSDFFEGQAEVPMMLEKLHYLRTQRRLAFAMSAHHFLGAASGLHELDPDLFPQIFRDS